MRQRWTNPALRDLSEIHAFIAEHNPRAALKVAPMPCAQAESLPSHPQMGRPGRIEDTRELVVARSAFIIADRVTETRVDVLALRHSARDGRTHWTIRRLRCQFAARGWQLMS